MPVQLFIEAKDAAQAWGGHAATYENTTQAFTRSGAEKLIDIVQNSAMPITASSSVIDVGAGTGVLAHYVAKKFPDTPILATDVAPQMLAQIDAMNVPNISTKTVDAAKLVEATGAEKFTHVLTTFMLQFVPDPQHCLEQIFTSLQPGGLVGIGIWGPRMDSQAVWTKACQMIDPAYRLEHFFGVPSAWINPDELTTAMEKADFRDVAHTSVLVRFPAQTAEQFAAFWIDTENPAIWSIIDTWKGSLDDVRRNMIQIIRDEYDDSRNMFASYTLAIGTKPAA